ncbi:MAG TPA: hypothetical protein VLB45_04785 [Nitrosopumilaceae archaeon]|nr:hypothetical protein [Nitrosopumilaceae archaeon]
MRKKKRYILVQLENNTNLGNFSDIKIISNEGSHAIVLCQLDKLTQVVSELEKQCKIVTVSGTLKSIRSSV